MSIWALAIFSGWAAVACWQDIRTRTIDWRWIAIGVSVATFGHMMDWWVWSWLGAVFGTLPLVLGSLPVGDRLAGLVLGGLLGVPWIIGAHIVTFTVGIGLMLGYRHGWWPWIGTWPFFPFLTGAACVMLGVRYLMGG